MEVGTLRQPLKNSLTPDPSPKGKGSKPLLPLNANNTIALIGPLANDRANIAGTWCVAYTPERYATIKEALEHRLPKGKLLYAQGCNLTHDADLQQAAEFGKNIPRVDAAKAKTEALAIAKKADIIVCAMGECADFSGESSSRATLEMPDAQRELLEELVKIGKPVVLLNSELLGSSYRTHLGARACGCHHERMVCGVRGWRRHC